MRSHVECSLILSPARASVMALHTEMCSDLEF